MDAGFATRIMWLSTSVAMADSHRWTVSMR
jgi:hypothetical protein